MDNTVLPYQDNNESESESESESDSEYESDDENGHLLTSNIGVIYTPTNHGKTLFGTDNKEYEKKRNRLFTPEITKRIITVDFTDISKIAHIEQDFGLPSKNIIGFKILKSSFVGDGGTTKYINLTLKELPGIACDTIFGNISIFARIPVRKENDIQYTHQFLELAMIDRYFYPITIDTMTFNLSVNLSGYITIEISYLNEL